MNQHPDDSYPLSRYYIDNIDFTLVLDPSVSRQLLEEIKGLLTERDAYFKAIDRELVTTGIWSEKLAADPEKAVREVINWHCAIALDPAVSPDAAALVEQGRRSKS